VAQALERLALEVQAYLCHGLEQSLETVGWADPVPHFRELPILVMVELEETAQAP
jgi:hypothetical protein